jgi:hypothetical protein
MADDEHYPANIRSCKAPLSMQLNEVVTLVGFILPETSPAVRKFRASASPAPSPFWLNGPWLGRAGPMAVAGRLVKARFSFAFVFFF